MPLIESTLTAYNTPAPASWAGVPSPAPAAEVVIEAVIRVPSNQTAEWVIRQLVALLADRADGARLDNFAIFPAAVFDAPEEPESIRLACAGPQAPTAGLGVAV